MIEVLPDRLAITALADDDIRPSYVKMAVAERLALHPIGGRQKIEWQGVAMAAGQQEGSEADGAEIYV